MTGKEKSETRKPFNMSRVQGFLTTEMTLLLVFIGVVFVFSILSPYFLTLDNFMKIGLYTAQMGVLAAGMTMALLSGGLDISVGSMMALVGMVCATQLSRGVSVVPTVFLGLAIGAVCGAVNGLIITKGRVNAFITTLGTMTIFRGLALLYSNGKTMLISNSAYNQIGRYYVFGVVPVPLIIMIIVFAISAFVLRYTVFGRRVYSIGGNEQASYLAGIPVLWIRFWVYLIIGVCGGMAGIMLSSQSGAGIPSAAGTINMEVISAVILGGTSLSGGKGKIIGTVLGVLILSTLGNGLNMLSVPSFYQEVIRGVVLIAAVIFDTMKNVKP
jgi:ribose transport system permease protein